MQNVFEIQISVIFKKLHMHHYSMVSQEDMDIKWPCLASRHYLTSADLSSLTTKQCTGSWKAPLYWIRPTSSNRIIGNKRLTLEQSDHFTLNFQATLFPIKWKQFSRYWSFVSGIHRWAVTSPHKGQWRGALMFILICALTNGWSNNRDAGDLRRHRAHYGVTVMIARHFHNILSPKPKGHHFVFSGMGIPVSWFKYHWNLFPIVQLTI